MTLSTWSIQYLCNLIWLSVRTYFRTQGKKMKWTTSDRFRIQQDIINLEFVAAKMVKIKKLIELQYNHVNCLKFANCKIHL